MEATVIAIITNRRNWKQPSPGSLSSASPVERAWKPGWVSKCKTLLSVFVGVLLSFPCTAVRWTGTRVMIVDDYRTIIWYQIKKLKVICKKMCLLLHSCSGQFFFFVTDWLHRHLRDASSYTNSFCCGLFYFPQTSVLCLSLLVLCILLRLVSCASLC